MEQRSNHAGSGSSSSAVTISDSDSSGNGTSQEAAGPARAFLVNVSPFLLLVGAWFFILINLGPRRLRKLYRKDPTMQGQFTVAVMTDSLRTSNTSGSKTETPWTNYEYWCEGKGLIVLVMRSAAFFPLNISGLSEAQRAELRSLLAAALPQK